MGEAEQAQPVIPTISLAYENVPQHISVVRNGDFVELIIPTRLGWRVWAVRQGVWAGCLLCGWVLWMLFPTFVAGAAAPPAIFLALPAALALIFGGCLIYRLLRAPQATILRWDGEALHAPAYTVAGGNDYSSGDPVRWSRAALGDLQVRPLWPVSITGCGTVKVVSRYDYPLCVGLYPIEPLREAVAEFRDIVLARVDADDAKGPA